jgi:RNA polymerase sigma-70 factor (ECF subfamily)
VGRLLDGIELTRCSRFGNMACVLPGAAMIEPRQNALRAPPAAVEPLRTVDPGAAALDAVMDRYARGEDAAFDDLYRRAAPRVRGFLLRLSGNAATADDLTQEAFLRVHRARGSFAPGASALPWLLAVARNVFRDGIRRAQARPATTSASSSETEILQVDAGPDARGDEALAARETLGVVRRTLAALPVLQREAFVLLRFEGMSVSEAADVLGASEGAVKVRAFRAYEALRAALEHANRSSGEAP